jgi:cytochrome c oxidase subunit 3
MSHEAAAPPSAYEAGKLGIWIFLGTEVMLFGALFTAYTFFRIQNPDLFHTEYLKLHRGLGAANTLVLITSSLAAALAVAGIRRGSYKLVKSCLAVTLALALAFLVIKYFEWTDEIAHGLLPGTNIFISLYFMMTGLHALHVLAGIAVLVTMLIWTQTGKISQTHTLPLELGGIYWHFVDLVWIYLFPLLYLIG